MKRKIVCVAALLGVIFMSRVQATTIRVTVRAGEKPLSGAIVSLENPSGKLIPPPADARLTATMDQHGMEFVPHTMAVQVGTRVYFPNSDNIRHDVYSFSRAKTFELPLYAGMSAPTVLFNQPGVVVLGCNIHDWMLGFIDVVPTPYFARTATGGKVVIRDVPPAHYRLTIWSPRLDAPGHIHQESVNVVGDAMQFDYALELGPARGHARRRPGGQVDPAAKALESKFKRFETDRNED